MIFLLEVWLNLVSSIESILYDVVNTLVSDIEPLFRRSQWEFFDNLLFRSSRAWKHNVWVLRCQSSLNSILVLEGFLFAYHVPIERQPWIEFINPILIIALHARALLEVTDSSPLSDLSDGDGICWWAFTAGTPLDGFSILYESFYGDTDRIVTCLLPWYQARCSTRNQGPGGDHELGQGLIGSLSLTARKDQARKGVGITSWTLACDFHCSTGTLEHKFSSMSS